MKRFLIGLMMAVLGVTGLYAEEVIPSGQAFLQALQPRDSVLVMDQFAYGFDLPDFPDSAKLGLPDIPQHPEALVGTVYAITPWKVDTLKVHKARRGRPCTRDLRASFILTPFDEGEYPLPALFAVRENRPGDADTLVFDPQVLQVRTMPVDTATYVPHDIKGQIRYPLTFAEVFPWICGLWLLAALVTAAVCLLKMRSRKEGEAALPDEPAHITALRLLDRYRGTQYWVPEKQKQFYSGVTDALRGYMSARYGIGAMEMTTAEIFESLKDTDLPPELGAEMRTLFERADFVKFAKHIATDEENATVLPQAVRFVTSTYQTAVEEEAAVAAEPEEKPVKRKEEVESDYMPR